MRPIESIMGSIMSFALGKFFNIGFNTRGKIDINAIVAIKDIKNAMDFFIFTIKKPPKILLWVYYILLKKLIQFTYNNNISNRRVSLCLI